MNAENKSPSPTSTHRRRLTQLLVAGAMLVSLAAFGAHRRGTVAVRTPAPNSPVAHPVPPTPTVVAPSANTQRPRVELVFALDTTGSMGGLLEGAKRKIWSLASFVARGQPTPELRVGLVAYRDLGDEYVTRVFDLDDDMDRVYARLRHLTADGGGDTPEHVARALDEAVHKMSWTKRKGVVRIVYLVGDAPPHTDYQDGFNLLTTAREAARRGIQIHTILCGSDPTTETSWRQVASLAHGQFLAIEQNGGMAEAHTPYDAELARLHDELSATAMGYGAKAGHVAASVASAAAAPAESKIERAGFMAAVGKALGGGGGDLVDDVSEGRVAVEAMPQAALPPALAATPPPKRAAKILEIKKSRDELAKKIEVASRARQEFLDRQDDKRKATGERDGFDAVAKKALRESVAAQPTSGLKL